MKKKNTKKKIMNNKAYIKETNYLVWECRSILQKFDNQNTEVLRNLWTMCLSCYGYGDDLRNVVFQWMKYPTEKNKEQLLKQISGIFELHKQMEDLEFALRKDNLLDATERESRKDIN